MKVLKDLVKILQKEKHDLLQKYEESQQQLLDSKSDLRLLREQLVRQRIGSINEGLSTSSSSQASAQQINQTNNTSNIKETLIKEIELLKEQKQMLENDLKIFLCQKEELEIERDSFKDKYNKLNEFLVGTADIIEYEEPKTDKNNNKLARKAQISLNVDEILSQNKYLNESNQHLKQELDMLKNSMKKLKTGSKLFNKNDYLEFQIDSSKNVLNKKRIICTLNKADAFIQEQTNSSSLSIELINDLKSLIESLLENLNDKITANLHQRKVNKMLATRIQDLEKQINCYLVPKSDILSSFDNDELSTDGMDTPIQSRGSIDKVSILNESVSLIHFEDDKSKDN